MKWVYLIGGGLVVLVAVVALIGAMLPREHRATRQARYRQKPDAIYFALAGPVDWRSDVKGFRQTAGSRWAPAVVGAGHPRAQGHVRTAGGREALAAGHAYRR